MKLSVSTFFAGLLFGAGLTVSQMTNPAKVMNFLDVFRYWDPSLAFVMLGALITTFIGYRLVLRGKGPLFAEKFRLPTRTDIDAPLLVGAALFGFGWGMSGLCPGPALAGLTFNGENGLIFAVSMLATMGVFHITNRGRV